jgi:hypothetical protein
MEAFRIREQQVVGLVGLGARVLLLAAGGAGALARQIAGFGGRIDQEDEMYAALSAVIDDPMGWDLFIMECDGFGGLEAALRAHRMLGATAERLPAILVSSDCRTQIFPEERNQPVILRSPASAVSLRVGMEHALRGRLNWRVG